MEPDPPPSRTELPPEPRYRSQRGNVLMAHAQVQEVSYDLSISLRAGLALLSHEIVLRNSGLSPAEARVRIPLDAQTDIAGLEVCRGASCRSAAWASVDAAESAYRAGSLSAGQELAPFSYATRLRDGFGEAIFVWVSPISQSPDTRIVLHTLRPVDPVGEFVRLSIPPRGDDLRAQPAEIHWEGVSAEAASATTIVPSSEPIRLIAPQPESGNESATVWTFQQPQSGQPWIYAYLRRNSITRAARHIVLLSDNSPSTLGGSRNRRMHTFLGLTNAAPEGSQISVISFASRPESMLERPVRVPTLSIQAVSRALGTDGGLRTNLAPALALARRTVRQSRLRPLIVVMTDGAFRESGPVDRLPETSVLLTGDNPAWNGPVDLAAAANGQVISVQEASDLATRTGDFTWLDGTLRPLFNEAPLPWAILRTGEGPPQEISLRPGQAARQLRPVSRRRWSLTQGGRTIRPQEAPSLWAAGLAARAYRLSGAPRRALLAISSGAGGSTAASRCEDGPSTGVGSGTLAPGSALFLAEARSCEAPLGAELTQARPPASSLPAASVLHRLRTRVIPPARRCLRADRRGRAHHSIRATFELVLSRREVVEQSVHGDLTPALRDCLLSTVNFLEVPSFGGALRIRYPIYTQAERPPIVEHRDDLWP